MTKFNPRLKRKREKANLEVECNFGHNITETTIKIYIKYKQGVTLIIVISDTVSPLLAFLLIPFSDELNLNLNAKACTMK